MVLWSYAKRVNMGWLANKTINMNEEKLALETLKALGAKDTSSPCQVKRGTTCFTLPTGDCISEHRTGYIRKNLLHKTGGMYTCYQLNPQYKTNKQVKWIMIKET